MLQISDKYLGQVCEPVTAGQLAPKNFGALTREMLAACWYTKPGRRVPTQIAVGLAANQLGLNIRMIVVDYAGFKGCMINPEILKYRGGTCRAEEGCLSFGKKVTYPIRHKIIQVEYLDETGELHRLKARGLLARIVQHEVDHLDGITMFDRVKLGPV